MWVNFIQGEDKITCQNWVSVKPFKSTMQKALVILLLGVDCDEECEFA
jgi:hypothetical protein